MRRPTCNLRVNYNGALPGHGLLLSLYKQVHCCTATKPVDELHCAIRDVEQRTELLGIVAHDEIHLRSAYSQDTILPISIWFHNEYVSDEQNNVVLRCLDTSSQTMYVLSWLRPSHL